MRKIIPLVWCAVAFTLPAEDGQQSPGTPAAGAAITNPTTRAEQIEYLRQLKARSLVPPQKTRLEQALDHVKNKKLIERITGGIGGVRIALGGLVTGSGFAIGPEYVRRDLLDHNITFRASTRGSLKKYYIMETRLTLRDLGGTSAFLDLYAAHRDYPRIDYYGPGPESRRGGRSDFKYEDTSFDLTAGFEMLPGLHLGGLGSYQLVNVGPGTRPGVISSEQIYTPATTPGIDRQTDFLRGGAFLNFDYRDNPGGPRTGGYYLARFSRYLDRSALRYSFDRLDLEVQQYIPFFNGRRVIALRGRGSFTDPRSGHLVPFYLQPTLGGPNDLRGFHEFRFYNNNAIVFNGEYRWEVFSGLDMALFVDAGKVFHDWHQTNLRDLEGAYGFGFRFNIRNDVFLRIDTGFSHEGFRIWFKFSNVF